MKKYEVFDQRFPEKHERGWNANLISRGTIEAEDSEQAFRLAKARARFPVLFNAEDYARALEQDKNYPIDE